MRGKLSLKGALAVSLALLITALAATPASAEFAVEDFERHLHQCRWQPCDPGGLAPIRDEHLL